MQGQRLPRLPPARRQGTSRWPEGLAAPTAALLLVAVLLTEALPKEVAFRGRLVRGVTGSVWSAVGFHTAFQTGAQLVLTHDAVEFAGERSTAMLAVGLVPFMVATIVVSVFGVPRWVSEPAYR